MKREAYKDILDKQIIYNNRLQDFKNQIADQRSSLNNSSSSLKFPVSRVSSPKEQGKFVLNDKNA